MTYDIRILFIILFSIIIALGFILIVTLLIINYLYNLILEIKDERGLK